VYPLPVKPHAGQPACRSTPMPVNPQLTYYLPNAAAVPFCAETLLVAYLAIADWFGSRDVTYY